MGSLTKILLGIILTLVIGISIYIPITNSHLTKLNKEMVAKDTVISELQSSNKQLNDRLILVQKLNDSYNFDINKISKDTQGLQNESIKFGNSQNIINNPVGIAVDVNNHLNSIFDEMSNFPNGIPTKGSKK